MKLLNNKPTFFRTDYQSQLDIILSNKANKITKIETIEDLDSDHNAVMITRNMNVVDTEEQYLRVRDLKK